MAFRLDPTAATGAELRRVLAEQLDASVAALRAPGGPDAEAVHDVRKRLKKARAALRLGRGDLGAGVARQANAELRVVGQGLSAQRDADALVETIDRLLASPAAAADPGAGDALGRVRRVLVDRAGGGGAARPGAPSVADAARSLERTARWLSLVPSRADGWAALGPGLRRQYRGCREALAGLGQAPTDEQLHEWRKRAKDVWYHLRLVRDGWPSALKPVVRAASDLAELLGEDHDLAVLRRSLAAPDRADVDVDGDTAVGRADVGGADPDGSVQDGGPADPSDEADRALVLALVQAERERLQAAARALGARLLAEDPRSWADRLGGWWRLAAIEAPPGGPAGPNA